MFEHCLVWNQIWNVFFRENMTCFLMWLHRFSMMHGIVTGTLGNVVNSEHYETYIVNLNMQTPIFCKLMQGRR